MVQKLRQATNTKISLTDALGRGPGAEQMVLIAGTQQAVEMVIAEVSHQVQMVSKEEWFIDWASVTIPNSSVAAPRMVPNVGTMSKPQEIYSPTFGQTPGLPKTSPGGAGLSVHAKA